MEWYEVELDSKRTVTLNDAWGDSVAGISQEQKEPADYMGGIIQDGRWGWVTRRFASEATLLVHCIASGESVARHTFWRDSGNQSEEQRSISCVEEILTDQPDGPVLLAVCLDSWIGDEQSPDIDKFRSHVHIYSVTHYQVLRIIDLGNLLGRTLAYLDQRLCSATQLARFDGCLSVATVEGIVLLIDLDYERSLANKDVDVGTQPTQSELHRIPGNKQMPYIDDLLEKCRANGEHLSVEVDVTSFEIRCLVALGFAPGFAAGLDDGSILIYDLINFQLTTTLRAPRKSEEFGTVERLCAIVPPDDPKPCFYICALYKGFNCLSMLLHSVNYSAVKQVGDGFHFQHFYATSVRNQLLLDRGDCSVTGCSTASTFSFAGDNGTLLAILSWHSHTERKNKLVLFDMNQWYKDEMPEGVHTYDSLHYLAGYILKGLPAGLALLLRPTSILHFVALQRCEEHFYPNSLTFDCQVLTPCTSLYYAHDGLQRRFLETLRKEKATLFFCAHLYHANIVRLRLLPQFCELNADATFSKSAMYEVILSVALEHGCTALLNDCASSWLDGSFLCNMLDPTELSLATLINWIVRRAGHIKKRISELCQGVFDYGGYSLDERERREFEALSEQMCELLRLQSHILTLGRRRLTSELVQKLESNERALQTVNEYQKVLYWFIKQGFLPEGQHEPHGGGRLQQQQQQPLVALRRSYAERRTQRRRLYIDSLTKQTSLVDPYPPDSLQALLHVMLDPNTDLAHKHKLLLYLLMDLDQGRAKLFPPSFRMHEPHARLVSCFWWLDRGDYKQCMAELYDNRTTSPKGFVAWETGLLVNTLLEAGAIKAAVRVVTQPPGGLANTLHLDVLLANNSVPEAFHNARIALDEKGQPLVERFFRYCIENRRFKVLAELCLTDDEEQMLYRLLQESRSPQAERVHLILLLLKSKYIEAAKFMDDVAAKRQHADDDASSSIMSAYRSTMAPVTQNIAGTYFRIRGKLDEDLADGPNAEHRLPLSSQLARQNARGQLGGIFQSCAINAVWAENCHVPDDSPPLPMRINGNIPFLRTEQYGFSKLPQPLRVVCPVPHQVVEKRYRELEECGKEAGTAVVQPRKRRRLQAEQLIENIRDQVNNLWSQQSDLERSQDQVKASDLVEPPTFLQRRKQPTLAEPNACSPVKIPTILKRRPVVESMVGGTPPTATSTSLSQPKCFRFQPPIPLPLDSSMAMESGGEDAADENEGPEEAEEEEEETDEIIMEIESHSEPRSAYSAESDEEEEVILSPLPTSTLSRMSHLSGTADTAKTKLSPPLMGPPVGPQPRGSLLQERPRTGTGIGSITGSESSSGFGSFATVQPAQTTSHSQFVPTVCSSKMYETQSQVFSTASQGMAKISERTTICGDMESTDLVASMAVTASSQWSMPAARLTGQTLRMLDTTLDMTTYDATSLEQGGEQDQDQDQDQDHEDITEVELENSEDQQENQQEEEAQSPPLPTLGSSSGASQVSSGSVNSPRRSSTCSEGEVELVSSNEEGTEAKSMQTNKEMADDQEDVEVKEMKVTERSEPGYQQMTYFGAGPQAPVEEPVPSPTRTSSCEGSELSSPEMRPQQQEVDLVSSNDEESTGSITTSRSVTHTPEGTFLPSDTNVSQASSPRAPHGPGGDGSPRSLYRANSLETVDDLDTTKGSLEEEEEDDEDDCVIALDGTEVRGYVARPQQATACSSAELFAFKDECADEAAPGPCPSLSLGATVNSDSVVADIIELNSDEEIVQQPQQPEVQEIEDPITNVDEGVNEVPELEMGHGEQHEEQAPAEPTVSVAQDEDSRQSLIDIIELNSDEEIVQQPQQPEVQEIEDPITNVDEGVNEKPESEMGHGEQHEEQAPAVPTVSVAQDEDSRQSLTLAFSEEEEETGDEEPEDKPPRSLRPRRNTSESDQDSPIVLKMRLRSTDSGGAPVVTTPKQRVAKHKALLEVIEEQGSLDTSTLPRTRSRSRHDADAHTPTKRLSNSRRAVSLAPTTEGPSVDSPKLRRSLRGISEPPTTPSRPTDEPKPVLTLRRRSLRNSSNDISSAVSPIPSESEQPSLSRIARRQNSEASETGSIPSGSQTRELRSRRRPDSTEPDPRLPARLSVRAFRAPIPTGVSSEAHVPLKKRRRAKKK